MAGKNVAKNDEEKNGRLVQKPGCKKEARTNIETIHREQVSLSLYFVGNTEGKARSQSLLCSSGGYVRMRVCVCVCMCAYVCEADLWIQYTAFGERYR